MPLQRFYLPASTRALSLIPVLAGMVAMAFQSPSAAKRCDWHAPTGSGETTYRQCVDYSALQGKTLDLPKNVTRISADGLSFCSGAFTTTGASANADIVFIFDNSGSMHADYAYIDPNTNDTLFYYIDKVDQCGNNRSKGTLTYQTKTGPRTIPLLQSNTNCDAVPSGDPYNARGQIIQNAIDTLAATSSSSTAGVVGFTEDISHPQAPLIMNNPANVKQVKDHVILDPTGGTFYRPPLNQAKNWLNDPSLTNTKKAIIFISDGAPHDSYLDLVDKKMPPIYSIFLSKAVTPDTANLKELSDKTGGTFSRVNPGVPAAMELLLRSIVKTITQNPVPKSVMLENKTVSQTSHSTGVNVNPDGSMGVALDSIVGLNTGANQIQMVVTRDDNSTVTYAFTLNVDGKDISSSDGNYSCYDMPTLTVLDAQGATPQVYGKDGTANYQVQLTRSPSDIKETSVDASSTTGDKETIALPPGKAPLGYPVQTGDFKIDPKQGSPSNDNGILEVADAGDLTFTWTHPRDARETVTYILPGKIVPVISGDVGISIEHPYTTGQTFTPTDIKDPIVIVDEKENCLTNCSGTENLAKSPVPTWDLVIRSPVRYSIHVFDNLGNFVNHSEGEMDNATWNSIHKSADSVTIKLKLLPVSDHGQQLGTGAYVMMAQITALGDQVTKDANGESIIVHSAKRDYVRRFGYLRQ